jgi:hypothetical protein
MLKLPPGYRYLKVGEMIKADDMYNAWGEGRWRLVSEVGATLDGTLRSPDTVEFCTRTKTKGGNDYPDLKL